jgi:AcrR family transcriptional regulator
MPSMSTTPALAPPHQRRTQEQRSTATRTALLEATVDCIVDYGYAGVTTARIVERAGVSRGAQVHHYPTKAALVVEAMSYLAEKRAASFAAGPARGARRVQPVLDMLWEEHSGPLFQASMELWVAARTDSELRASLRTIETLVLTRIYEYAEANFGEAARARAFREDLEMTLATMRGLAQLLMLNDDPEPVRRRWLTSRKQLVAILERHLAP